MADTACKPRGDVHDPSSTVFREVAHLKRSSVSVAIPTLNSERTIARCLQSISSQTILPAEIIIVDGGSTDQTEELVSDFACATWIERPGGILVARETAARMATGAKVLLLDSDQLLMPTALARCEADTAQMGVLGERSFRPRTFTEHLFDFDRQLIQLRPRLDPGGVLLPRLFDRKLLVSVFDALTFEIAEAVVSEDHALIFHEAYLRTNTVSFLPDAVLHIEKENLRHLLRHYYRFGVATARVNSDAHFRRTYTPVMRQKRRPRPFVWRRPLLSVASAALVGLKYCAYRAGELHYFSKSRFSHQDAD